MNNSKIIKSNLGFVPFLKNKYLKNSLYKTNNNNNDSYEEWKLLTKKIKQK